MALQGRRVWNKVLFQSDALCAEVPHSHLTLNFPKKRNKVRGSRKVEVRKRNAALVYENVVQYWYIVEITTHV